MSGKVASNDYFYQIPPGTICFRPAAQTMNRQRVTTGAPWEDIVGYSRAIRAGNQVWVSGTAPVAPDGTTVAPGDPRGQALRCLEIIEHALHEAGASLADVVRTRIYVVDIGHWEAIGRAHGEYFGSIRPATTMVQVSALIAPDMLVEIEAEAVVG